MSGGAGTDKFYFDATDTSPGYGDDNISQPFGLGSGRDFNLANDDTLVFDVDAGFDPSVDMVVVSGDWDGQGDALDVYVITSAGTVLIEDFWEGISGPALAEVTVGLYDSVEAMNAYSQGQSNYDMITFV